MVSLTAVEDGDPLKPYDSNKNLSLWIAGSDQWDKCLALCGWENMKNKSNFGGITLVFIKNKFRLQGPTRDYMSFIKSGKGQSCG